MLKYAQILAFYHVRLNEFDMPVHTHERFEIMYAADGSCTVELPNTKISLSEKQLVLIAPQIPHKLVVHQGKPCIVLNLEFYMGSSPNTQAAILALDRLTKMCAAIFEIFNNLEYSNGYVILNDHSNLYDCLKELIHEQAKKENPYYIHLLFERMLVVLATRTSQKKAEYSIEYIKQAKQYMDRNYTNQLRVSDVADHIGVHPSYLQFLFAKYQCGSVNDYILKKRVQKSAFLIRFSDMSLTDIAISVGFNSRQHFRSTFFKAYGMNPSEYRKVSYGKPIDAESNALTGYVGDFLY